MTTKITDADLIGLDDAIGYDQISTIGAAYARLIELRKLISQGEQVQLICEPQVTMFDSVEAFDGWVRTRFPNFCDDELHPAFIVRIGSLDQPSTPATFSNYK